MHFLYTYTIQPSTEKKMVQRSFNLVNIHTQIYKKDFRLFINVIIILMYIYIIFIN